MSNSVQSKTNMTKHSKTLTTTKPMLFMFTETRQPRVKFGKNTSKSLKMSPPPKINFCYFCKTPWKLLGSMGDVRGKFP